jgi:hypothetical protein
MTTTSDAVTPEAKCAAGKIDLSGKYAACVSKAEKALVLKGDAVKHATQLAQCEGKLTAKWAKLEAAGTCWSQGDGPKVQDLVEGAVWGVTKGVTFGGEPGGNPSAYVTSVECFELQQCCIVKVTYYNPLLDINVTNSYSNCNSSHTYVQL